MKRPVFHVAAMLLCTMLLPLCACKKRADVPVETPVPAQTAALDAPVETPASAEPVGTHARAYGEAVSLTADHNGYTGTLYYPLGDIDVINQALSSWATNTFAAHETAALTLPANADGIKATLSVNYDAYDAFARYYGVKETGQLTPSTGRATNIIYTYNYDVVQGKALTLGDVLKSAEITDVAALLTGHLLIKDGSALGGKTALSAEDLTNFVVRGDGVEWLFSGASGVVSVVLDYQTLSDCLVLDTTPAKAPVLDAASSAPASSAASANKPAIEQTATSLYDGVHVRSGPATENTDILGVLGEGETIDVTKANVSSGWHEVWYGGQTAYVFASLVHLNSDTKAYTTGWVTGSYLHVRADADVDSELLGTLQSAERVQIVDLAPINGFYKIWFEGRYAYVYATYIHIGSAPATDGAAASAAPSSEAVIAPRIVNSSTVSLVGVGTCTVNGVVIRSEANGQSAQYGKLNKGDQVYLIARSFAADWDKIFVFTASARGYVGFVRSQYVQTNVAAN